LPYSMIVDIYYYKILIVIAGIRFICAKKYA